jgi:hypothetical protein
MIRLAAALFLIVLPSAASAQAEGGALGPVPSGPDRMEQMSRAQVEQTIADQGYFEMDDLTRQRDGSWTCTAMAGPDRRVALTILRNGTILQKDLPRDGAH